MTSANTKVIPVLLRATGQRERRSIVSSYEAYAGRVGHADQGQKKTDAARAGHLERVRDQLDDPLAQSGEREEDEYEALDEDGGEGETVRYRSCAVEADDLIGEVGAQVPGSDGWYQLRRFSWCDDVTQKSFKRTRVQPAYSLRGQTMQLQNN